MTPQWYRRAVVCMPSVLVVGCLGSGADPVAPVASSNPPGPDTTQPFPLDRGDDGVGTPGTYKALALRLTDNGTPVVTPVDGVIGVVCIGMSNANQECTDYISRLRSQYADEVNPAVRIVNCAVGGHAIERWIQPNDDAALWNDCIVRKLPFAGIRLDQVRVLFHKAANQFTLAASGSALPTYPAAGSDFENFRDNLTSFAARVTSKFPAVPGGVHVIAQLRRLHHQCGARRTTEL